MTGLERGTASGSSTVAAAAAVQAVRLGKSFDDRVVLHEVSFAVPAGSFVALLGANGAGKSTLMKILATLMPHSEGELHLFGQPLRRDLVGVRSRIGLIGHQAMLYRDLSPRENLLFFGKLYGVDDPAARADQMLAAVGLSHRANDPVKDFSRGMTQRVAIARALMHNPDLLLADEPFAGLDVPSARGLELLLTQLHQSGKTILLANHDIDQSLRLSQRAIVLRRGQLVIDRPSHELTGAQVIAEVSA